MESKSFGQILENARKDLGISAREASKIVQISNSTWSRWERDESFPDNLETLAKVCDLLDLNFFDMITVIYPSLKTKYSTEFKILKCLNLMDFEDSRIILRISESIASSL